MSIFIILAAYYSDNKGKVLHYVSPLLKLPGSIYMLLKVYKGFSRTFEITVQRSSILLYHFYILFSLFRLG